MIARLPQLHVFGRVAPEDKLRLARLMQEQGLIVAMTGDAVNDAAALKQADIGVAMGSGSEVTKQAGKIVLTDDNFGTLVHAVELGRDIYRQDHRRTCAPADACCRRWCSSSSLATIFNINERRGAVPDAVAVLQVLRRRHGRDRVHRRSIPATPSVMHRPPRDPKQPIVEPRRR